MFINNRVVLNVIGILYMYNLKPISIPLVSSTEGKPLKSKRLWGSIIINGDCSCPPNNSVNWYYIFVLFSGIRLHVVNNICVH